jgi:hypothetical protein
MNRELSFKYMSLRSKANWCLYQLHAQGLQIRGSYSDWFTLGIKPIGYGGLPINPTSAEGIFYKNIYKDKLNSVTVSNLNLYIEYLKCSEDYKELLNHDNTDTPSIHKLEVESGKVYKVVSNYKAILNKAGYTNSVFTKLPIDVEAQCLPYLMKSHTAFSGTPVWSESYSAVMKKLDKAKMDLGIDFFTYEKTPKDLVYTFDPILLTISPTNVPVIHDTLVDTDTGIIPPEELNYAFVYTKLLKKIETGKANEEEIDEYNFIINAIIDKNFDSIRNNTHVRVKSYCVPPDKVTFKHRWYKCIRFDNITSSMVTGNIPNELSFYSQLLLSMQGYLATQSWESNLESDDFVTFVSDDPYTYYDYSVDVEDSTYAPSLYKSDFIPQDLEVPEELDEFNILPVMKELIKEGHVQFEIPYGYSYDEYLLSLVKVVNYIRNRSTDYAFVENARER